VHSPIATWSTDKRASAHAAIRSFEHGPPWSPLPAPASGSCPRLTTELRPGPYGEGVTFVVLGVAVLLLYAVMAVRMASVARRDPARIFQIGKYGRTKPRSTDEVGGVSVP
jgi:hypothetical protein